MPIDVTWHDEQHSIIRHIITAPWTIEDMYHALDATRALFGTTQQPILGLLVDGSKSGPPPRQAGRVLRKYLAAHEPLPLAFCNLSHLAKVTFETFQQAYQTERPIIYVKTLAEAEQALRQSTDQGT